MAVFGHREDKSKVNLLEFMYPVGSIYISVNSTNPNSLFGGTWKQWGNGRVPVGVDTTQAEFNATEKTGGEKTHTLSVAEMPSHNHSYSETNNESGKIATKFNYTHIPPDKTTYETSVANGEIDHTHTINKTSSSTGNSGSSSAHNNLQPYITCYMWKRTA